MVLIQREDTGTNNFDIEFNYDRIEWEAGDLYSGYNGYGSNSARAGFCNGEGATGYGDNGLSMEISGSAETMSFLDRDPVSRILTPTGLVHQNVNAPYPGRILIPFRGGYVSGSQFKIEAGPNQTLTANQSGTLQLQGSVTKPDAGEVTYQWIQISGAGLAVISDPASLAPIVTLTHPGRNTFQLIGKRVINGVLNFYSQDKVEITHQAALVVTAGDDQNVGNSGPTKDIQLLGSASYSGSAAMALQWTQEEGNPAIFSNENIAQPIVTLPSFGVYQFRLTATVNGFTKSDVIVINYFETSDA